MIKPLNTFLNSTLATLLLVSATALNADESPEQLLIKVEPNELQATPKGKLPLDELRNFAEVFDRIRASYVEEVDDKTLLQYAINGMLTSLDPHSTYLLPEDFSDLKESTTGKFGGLGIEIDSDDGYIRVISPIDDTPAYKAGIKAGDLIVTIGDQPIKDMSLSKAVEKMRGEVGTEVSLEVRRKGEDDLLSFTIKRAEIKMASVRHKPIAAGIHYFRITQFQELSGKDLIKKIKKLIDNKDDLNGIVLDLRNNPGGVLGAAVDVSNAFVDSGLIVYTKGRETTANMEFKADSDTIAPDVPLVVLINGGSASASEIVAGALQDHQRAVILGTDSFGKGSVQSVLPITEDKAIKLTTARYYTPNGRSIQAQGIEPDVWIEAGKVDSIGGREYFKESDLPGHLKNGDGDSDEKKRKAHDTENLLKNDVQLYQAYNLLKGVHLLQKKTTAEADSKKIKK